MSAPCQVITLGDPIRQTGAIAWSELGRLRTGREASAAATMIQVNRNPTRSQLRWFAALVFPLFWGWVAFLLHARAGLTRSAIAIAAAALAISIAGLLSPAFMRRVWIAMMVGLSPIGWVISHLILGVIYYLVLTPIGLALRAWGRDPLQRRFDREAGSYWIDRRETPDVERYFRQY